MSTAIDRRAVVRTLSVRSSGRDALTDRLRAEQLLGAVDLHPPSLPPAAILCVRTLRDPRPGVLTLDGRSLRPPPAWEEALGAALEAVVRRAARPWQGSVSAGAEAVIFTDRSELLACLAVDLARGDVGARWWWASLVPDHRAPGAAVAAWIAAAEHVPGALHLLAERREIEPFVRALSLAEGRAILRAVTDRFGIPALAVTIERAAPHLDPARASVPPDASDPRDEPPWMRWAPELRSAALPREWMALLGVGLALHRAPGAARSLAFAEAARRWAAPPREPDAKAPIAAESTHESSPRATSTAPPASSLVALAPSAPRAAAEPTPRAAPLEDADAPPSSPIAAAHPGPSSPPDPAAISSGAVASPAGANAAAPPLSTLHNLEATAPDAILIDPVTAASAPASEAPATTAPAPAAGSPPLLPAAEPTLDLPGRAPRRFFAPIVTDFGGVFFLVNLALYLDLYGDFSAPQHPGLDLPLWDFLALVGRELVGDALLEDPVWPLLADLAGRDSTAPPGAGFTPPDAWRLPPSWLRAFPEPAAWSWSARGDHLTIHHPAGFDVVEAAIDGDPAEQARREASGYGALEITPATAPLAPGPQAPLDRWLARVLPYVRARLARALGTTGEAPGQRLCALAAQVHATATHLDVTMSLAELPIEVRFAGLDRDPGWVPAAGRFIAFHFE